MAIGARCSTASPGNTNEATGLAPYSTALAAVTAVATATTALPRPPDHGGRDSVTLFYFP